LRPQSRLYGLSSSIASGSWRVRRLLRLPLLLASILPLAACYQTAATPTPVSDPMVGQRPQDVKYYRSDEPVRLGIQRFYEGDFGLSQMYFQDAVERSPKDATAWIGLAASYDRLGRFDLADRSYAQARRLVGNTGSLLNNEGYSYMLRGDLGRARAKFEAALRVSPSNPVTTNNLALLDSSSKYIDRASDGEPCSSVMC
jgi:Flp pilus assembly protein TadD